MNLEQLRKQAKELVKAAQAGDPDALARLDGREPILARAQLVLAREHGLGLRYVIKRELQMLPAIDIGGRWVQLPTTYVGGFAIADVDHLSPFAVGPRVPEVHAAVAPERLRALSVP